MITAVEAQPREISSSATAYASDDMPAPPYFSGTIMPKSPSSAIAATCLAGYACDASIWPATG